jgi:hypothetical protein
VYHFWWGILNEKYDTKDLSLDGNIALKWILKNMIEGENWIRTVQDRNL